MKDNEQDYYEFMHVCKDVPNYPKSYKVAVSFNTDHISEIIEAFALFLEGCTYSEVSIRNAFRNYLNDKEADPYGSLR